MAGIAEPDVVWRSIFRKDRDTSCENIYEQYPDRIFVTGHVPVQRIHPKLYINNDTSPAPVRVGNLLNIDGGLAFGHTGISNAAIFLRLEDAKVFPIQLL